MPGVWRTVRPHEAMSELLVAPCAADAARHAVMNWHYSQAMPVGKLVTFGVWEDGQFVGAVLYGRGAAPNLVKPYGLTQTSGCELVRVALRHHDHHVTEIVAASLKQLRRTNPGMRLVVSFADPKEGHHGGIYQAGNWIYAGTTDSGVELLFEGKWHHSRMARQTGWGTVPRLARLTPAQQAKLPRRKTIPKHRYLYPLDRAMRRQITKLALPYPTPCDGSVNGDTPESRSGESSSILDRRSTAKTAT